MKITIWKEDDFFQFTNNPDLRIDMDPIVVEVDKEPTPLLWNFNILLGPIGSVSDIRIENGELVGELEWFEDNEKTYRDMFGAVAYRYGGTYGRVLREVVEPGTQEHVTSCVLQSVSIMPSFTSPGYKERL